MVLNGIASEAFAVPFFMVVWWVVRRPYVVMQLHGSFPSLLNWSQTIIVHLQLKASKTLWSLSSFVFAIYSCLSGTLFSWVLNVAKSGDSTNSLSSLFWCLVALAAIWFFFFCFLVFKWIFFFSFQFNLTVFRHFLQLLYLRNHAIYLRLHPAFSSECVLLNWTCCCVPRKNQVLFFVCVWVCLNTTCKIW